MYNNKQTNKQKKSQKKLNSIKLNEYLMISVVLFQHLIHQHHLIGWQVFHHRANVSTVSWFPAIDIKILALHINPLPISNRLVRVPNKCPNIIVKYDQHTVNHHEQYSKYLYTVIYERNLM